MFSLNLTIPLDSTNLTSYKYCLSYELYRVLYLDPLTLPRVKIINGESEVARAVPFTGEFLPVLFSRENNDRAMR